jgi:hypothetical protein
LRRRRLANPLPCGQDLAPRTMNTTRSGRISRVGLVERRHRDEGTWGRNIVLQHQWT